MNKYRYILYIICALCTLSCVDDKMPNGGTFLDRPYHLSIGKHALSFGASQNLSENIVINSNDVSWEITGAPDWLTLSATDGTGNAVVTVTASENKSIDNPRAALLNITSTSPKYQYNKSIAVSQAAMAVGITVDKTSLSLAPQAVTESVAVNSNVEWEATCSSSWIILSKTGDTALQISASENRTGTERTATVNLCRKGFTATLATISVTQSEGGVTGSTEELAFGIDGGTKSVEIDADVAWNASSSASWLAVTPEEGAAGKAQLKITALANSSANSRNGFAYVKIGDVKKLSIPVSQEGISLEVNGTLQNFAASGSDSQKLSVTANKEWKVLSSPEWVTVTPGEGSKGTTEVAVKAAENRSLNPRSATFRIGFEGLNVYKDITVAQEGLDSEFGGSTLEFPWEASQKDIEIVLPDSWSAMVSSDWISLSQYSGNGGEKVDVIVQTNDNEDARTGTVTFVTEGRTFSFSVVQQGQYLKINSTAGEVAAMGGSVELSITTTVGAKDSIEYDGAANGWLAVSDDSNGKYTLTAVYNPSMNPRVAQFVIKPTMDATNSTCTQGVRFTVTQKGRNLMASTDKIEMFKSGGTSATYTITADGRYSISKPDADNWYVLQHDEKAQSFTLYLSENRTDDTRESQLTISLLELLEGESKQVIIPVIQYAGGVNIGVDIDGWGDDREWSALSGTLNGHDWVDLELPSGLKWATCNVGASSPEDYGNYYAWGETTTKSDYSSSTSTTYGKDMSDISGNATYDVARKQWGSTWRLPTKAEFDELLDEDNCTWTWTTLDGVNGYRVTSKVNGKSIFLPAAGGRSGASLYNAGSLGNYWSSTPYGSNTSYAYFLFFDSGRHYTGLNDRFGGRSVRPVTE
ncbi:MAG: hypothetical protein IJ513_03145 [Bacteroidaceae bacterium]|nr:hypothetical protein [Bacteroidaceae bacterium]